MTGGNYVLSWFDNTGESGGLTGSVYRVSVVDSLLNTVISQAFDAYLAGVNNWQQKSLNMSLSPGNYDLTFRAAGVPSGLDTLIDNVSLNASTVAASAPEPTSWLLVVTGLVGSLGYNWRKMKKATQV